MIRQLALSLSLAGAAVVAQAADPAPVAVYTFANTLASSVAGTPALTVTDPLGLSGFGSDVVNGNTVTVYNFRGTAANAEQAGLSLDVSAILAGHYDQYSVEIIFKFTERDNAWRRILDVQNRQSDNGFYVDPSNRLDIYPVSSGETFTNNVYHDVFLVNNQGTATFYLDVYLDGGTATTVTTTVMNVDPNGVMNFFLDNVVAGGQGEYSSGSVAQIRIYDAALAGPPPALVPEPASWALLALGAAVVGAAARRRSAVSA